MTWQGGKRPAEETAATTPFAPLKPLMTAERNDVAESLQSLARALGDYGSPVRIHVHLIDDKDDEKIEHWEIQSGSPRPAARRSKPKQADVLVAMRPETWMLIAQGRLAPFDALFAGKLRVGGNLEVAKRLTRHLSDPRVPFVPPC
jgi:SCP-2 sterol transfer family